MAHLIPKSIIFIIYAGMIFSRASGGVTSSFASSSSNAAAIAISSSSGNGPKNCNNICTADYNPVCGYNGKCYKTFGNQCAMDNENCNLPACERKFEKVSCTTCEEACLSPLCPTKPDCQRACPFIYAPICGVNNVCFRTFGNSCLLKVWNCENPNNQFSAVKDGECDPCWFPCPY